MGVILCPFLRIFLETHAPFRYCSILRRDWGEPTLLSVKWCLASAA
jgi:hypothetical protein